MADTFQVRNPSGVSIVLIKDLGQEIQISETFDLLNVKDPVEILNSQELDGYLSAGTLIRYRSGGDVAYALAYDDLIVPQTTHKVGTSWARSIALLGESYGTVADSIADLAEGRASEATSIADIGLSVARRAESQGTLDNSIADRAESLAKRAESQGALDNSIADRAQSLAKSAESQGTLDNSIADKAESLARLAKSEALVSSEGTSLATSEANNAEGKASEARSFAVSLANATDISEIASIADVADSIADYAEDRASEASSIAERASSLARLAVETSDISEAASLGHRGISIARLAESVSDLAESVAEDADSEADIATSLARRSSEGVSMADSEITIVDSEVEVVSEAASISKSMADLAKSFAVVGDSVADLTEGRASEATSIAERAQSLARLSSGVSHYVQNTTPAGASEGDHWFHTDQNIWYAFEGTDWLSDEKITLGFANKGNVDGGYINIWGQPTNPDTGHEVLRNARLLYVTARASGGNTTKSFEIRKNVAHTTVHSFSLTASRYGSATVNQDLTAQDFLTCYCSSTGASVANPVITAVICWRIAGV